MDTKPVSEPPTSPRIRFDPEREECWGWWWNPDLAADLPLDDDHWPKWTDEDPEDYDRVKNWYIDNGFQPPVKPVYTTAVAATAAIASQPVKRAAPNARVKGGVAVETRDAGKRARRMKRYMVWWRQADAARKAGQPEPPRPVEGFGDPPDKGDGNVH